MNPINPQNDGLENLLEAGELRAEAGQLHARAELLEQTAALQLQQSEANQNIGVRMVGNLLVLAHGGPADGTMIQLPVASLNDSIGLMARPGANIRPEEITAKHRYQPALILQLSDHVAGALLVPYGSIATYARNIGRSRSGAARATALLVTHAIGFNPELAVGVIRSVVQCLEGSSQPDTALVLQLGQLRA